MVITRIINEECISFHLTEDEAMEAYKEVQHQFDMFDVRNALEDILYEEEITDELVDEVAHFFRENVNYNENYFDDLIEYVHTYINLYRKDLLDENA